MRTVSDEEPELVFQSDSVLLFSCGEFGFMPIVSSLLMELLAFQVSCTIYKGILLLLVAFSLFVQAGSGERSRLRIAMLVGFDVLMAAVW